MCLLPVVVHSARAVADDTPARWREISAGADVTGNVWLIYTGSTLAPFGDIHEDGLRLRFSGGYGQYGYSGLRSPRPGVVPAEPRAFDAETTFADAMVGYQWKLGPLTAKAFAGASGIGHTISPFDPWMDVSGLEWGAKGIVELWLDVVPAVWASLDLSYAQAHRTYSARTRVGYRVLPTLSVGAEAAVNGNAVGSEGLLSSRVPHAPYDAIDYSSGRLGGFVRYEWYGGEISASAGVAGDIDRAEPSTAYATINWLMQF